MPSLPDPDSLRAGEDLFAAASSSAVVSVPITGDYRVDTLIDHENGVPLYRWNSDSPLGTPLARPVTYSFMTVKPSYGGTDTDTDHGFERFSELQVQAARAIFGRLERETGLRFMEVADSDSSYGQIRLGNNRQDVSSGYAYLPNSGDDLSGDVWLDSSTRGMLTDLVPGSFPLATLVHEIGHAVGLKHPGNYNAGEGSTSVPGNYLGSDEDNTLYTIMSYNDWGNGLQRDWFGVYDLLALRALYGAGSGNAGDTVHRITDTHAGWMSTLYDAGGTDTLDASATTANNVVDLRAGAASSIGGGRSWLARDNVSIDLSTVIERYVGGSGDDRVTGNSANNRFALGAGANTADGGSGIDTVAYANASAAYTRSASSGVIRVTGGGASDTLTNVERLSFSDTSFAFGASAQTAAKILGAVFGREAVANRAYAGIGLSLLDAGSAYADLMQLALTARFGGPASNDAVVQALYTNVVGQAPGAGEVAHFSGLVASGQLTQVSLAMMAADHPLNAAGVNLVGIAASGLAFA